MEVLCGVLLMLVSAICGCAQHLECTVDQTVHPTCLLTKNCCLGVIHQAAFKCLCDRIKELQWLVGCLKVLSGKTNEHHACLWDGVLPRHPTIIVHHASTLPWECLRLSQPRVFLKL